MTENITICLKNYEFEKILDFGKRGNPEYNYT